MLRYLRENTGNWIIKFFLVIIVVVFVFLGVGSMNASKHNEIATVNDQPITVGEYRDAYRNIVQRLQQQFGQSLDDDMIKAFNVKQQAVNSLVDQKILDLEAEKLKIVVTDEELKKSVLSFKAFQRDGVFDMDLYKRVLGQNAMTPETFEAMQRQSIKNTKLQRMVLNGITVGDQEAQAWYKFNNTEAAIDYLQIIPQTFLDAVPIDEEILTQYDDHHDLYMSEPMRKAACLVFSPEDYKDQVTVNPEDVRGIYEQNIASYTKPAQVEASHILIKVDEDADETAVEKARTQARDVYEKAAKGDDFSKLAKTFSQGPSASRGGYLGRFEKSSMVKPFADAAFAMNAGDISEPVRTRFGWHVIKVTDKTDKTVIPFEEVQDKIQEEMALSEAGSLAYNKAEEAFDAVLDGDGFGQVALVAGKKAVTTKAFASSGSQLTGMGISDPGQFAAEAFALADDEISDVKKIGNSYYLMHVVEKIDPQLLPFDEVKKKIKSMLTAERQKAAAQKAAASMLENAGDEKSIEKIAQTNKLDVQTSEMFTRNGMVPGIPGSNAVAEAAFTLTEKNQVYKKALEAGGSFYIVALKEMKVPDADAISENLDTVKQELERTKQQAHYTAWLSSLRDKADIHINTEIIN